VNGVFSNEKQLRVSFRRIFWGLSLVVFCLLWVPPVRQFFFANLGRWLYILLFASSTSALLTPIVRLLAHRTGIVDRPGGRKIHAQSTALLGGVAVILSFIGALLANMILDARTVALLAGGVVMAVVGLLDDARNVPARYKLIIQVAVVLFLIHSGIILDLFPIHTTWGYLLNAALTILWIVGLTNAMNFIDGMDGLATGLAAIIALFLGIVAFQTDQSTLGWIAIAILGGCLGFLPYNFRVDKPALIFLGDTGSIFLGFVLSSLAIIGHWADNNPIVSFAAPVLIFWVLIFDMTYITVERVLTGKVKTVKDWIDYVGKDHIHHRTYTLLGDKRKAVLFIYLLAATLGVSAIALRNARPVDGVLLVTQAFFITIIVAIMDYSGRHRH